MNIAVHRVSDVSNNFNFASPNCKAEAEAGTCKSDPNYMSAVCDKLYCYGGNLLLEMTYFNRKIVQDFKTIRIVSSITLSIVY